MNVASRNGRSRETLPPADPNAEKSVLGCILLTPDVLGTVRGIIGDEDFYDPAHAAVFLAACDCCEAGDAVDPVTVADRLATAGRLEDVGGLDTMREFLETVPHAFHADYYARIVAEKARRRRLYYAGYKLAEKAADPATADEDLAELSQRIQGMASGMRQYGAIVDRLSDVEVCELEWLWPNRIPLGKLTLLAGDPGLGKSFLTLDMAARVSTGRGWPDDSDAGQPAGSVVLLNAEDDAADTIAPRLQRAGADLLRIHLLRAMRGDNGKGTRSFNLEYDLSALEQTIQAAGDARLVVIDPVSAYCGRTDSHRNTDVRSLLAPLAELAGRHQVAVLAVTHLSKGIGGKAIYRAMGSLAFAAAARAVWAVVKDQNDPKRRLVLPAKNNLAVETDGLAYAIIDGVVAWERDPVTLSADEAFAAEAQRQNGEQPAEWKDAAEWLRDVLAEGRVPSKDVKDAAKRNGFGEKTLRTARERIGVELQRDGFGPGSTVYWALPDSA